MAIFEPLGLQNPTPNTLVGYPYNWASITMISLSAVLGLLVSMSTFLVIGALSSVTYNVVGHLKTVIILAGGFFLFAVRILARSKTSRGGLAGCVLDRCIHGCISICSECLMIPSCSMIDLLKVQCHVWAPGDACLITLG